MPLRCNDNRSRPATQPAISNSPFAVDVWKTVRAISASCPSGTYCRKRQKLNPGPMANCRPRQEMNNGAKYTTKMIFHCAWIVYCHCILMQYSHWKTDTKGERESRTKKTEWSQCFVSFDAFKLPVLPGRQKHSANTKQAPFILRSAGFYGLNATNPKWSSSEYWKGEENLGQTCRPRFTWKMTAVLVVSTLEFLSKLGLKTVAWLDQLYKISWFRP